MDKKPGQVSERTWEEFRATGLLWWINRILHTFGWAIVLAAGAESAEAKAFPARVTYRGFDEDVDEKGYVKVTKHLAAIADELKREVSDERA